MIDFFIVGAQKSSSTFLHHAIAVNSDAYMPSGETSIFQPRHYSNSKVDGFVEKLPNDKLLGIKRPIYLYDSQTAENIRMHNPEAKILVVLRDPVERAMSCFAHLMANAQIPWMTYEEGLRKILLAEESADWPQAYTVLYHSIYSTGLDCYIRLFGRSQVLTIDQRRLRIQQDEQMNLIWEFLSLPRADVNHLVNKPMQSVTYGLEALKYLNKASQIESLCNQSGVALQRRRKLSHFRKRQSRYFRLKASRLKVGAEKPELPQPLIADLKQFFANEYELISQKVGIDFRKPVSSI